MRSDLLTRKQNARLCRVVQHADDLFAIVALDFVSIVVLCETEDVAISIFTRFEVP